MPSSMPQEYLIKDTQDSTFFKKKTISNYKKNDVIKSFRAAIINYKLEDACYWMVELHCSGLVFVIIDELFKIYFSHIHLKNPKLLFYIHKKTIYLKNILNNYKSNYIIFTRNSQEIRNLLIEITAMCTLSKKTNLFINKYYPKVKKENYDTAFIKNNIISKNLDLIMPYLNNNNPIEIILTINEILNLIDIKNSFNKILFWVLWLKKISINKIKDNLSFNCFELNNNYTTNLRNNLKTRWEIHLWNIVLDKTTSIDIMSSKYIIILYNNFNNKLNIKNINNRTTFILIALYILSMYINWDTKLYTHESQTLEACCNINTLYGNIDKMLIKNMNSNDIQIRTNNYYTFKENNLSQNKIIKKIITKKQNITKNKYKDCDYNKPNQKKLNIFSNLICYK